ncbi:hypothetical protein ACSBR2_032792 [Camellia fascicularis]
MAISGNPSDHRATPTIAKSTEEEDHLIRSTKKIKSSNSTAFIESENEVVMVTEERGENSTSQTPALQENIPAKSFKEALTTAPNRDYTFNSRVEILSSDEEDEDQEGATSIVYSISEYMGLPKGEFNAIDLGCNYFLFKFSLPEDYSKVYTGGPWVIMDHYLTIRRLKPNFKPSEAFETTTAIWVRFPELPIEYYQDKVLFAIAETIDKPLKIDWTTTMATRDKFARICVELDLTKPLKPKFVLEDKCYYIEYESLHSFCFLCGCIDHRKEACRFKVPHPQPESSNLAVSGETTNHTPTMVPNSNLQPKENAEEEFGPRMLATKRTDSVQEAPGPNWPNFKV